MISLTRGADNIPRIPQNRGMETTAGASYIPLAEKIANHPLRFASNHSANDQQLKRTKQSFSMLTILRSYLGTKSGARFAEHSANTLPALPLRL